MIEQIVYAILQFFLDACISLDKAYSVRRKDKSDNQKEIDALMNSKTDKEQQDATDALGDDFK